MGYAVLWLENLALVLLLTATATAVSSPWKWRVLRVGLPLVIALVILIGHAACTAVAAVLGVLGPRRLAPEWFGLLAALTLCCGVGMGWILWVGLRGDREVPTRPRAARWPRANLALGFALVLAMYLMTLWNLDLAVRNQAGALHAESGALALSVAPARVSDRDNAALVYARAFQAGGAPDKWPKAFGNTWSHWVGNNPANPGFDPKDAGLRAFLRQQAGTLALLREAGHKPGCYFERDYGRPAIDMMMPEVFDLRAGAWLLTLDARVKAADHDMQEALRDCRAILAMSEHVASDPIMVSMLVSTVVQDIAVATLEAVLKSAPADAQELAELDVGENLSYQRVFLRAVRMEDAFQLRAIYDIASGRIPLHFLMDQPGQTPADWWFVPVYRLFLLHEDLNAQQEVAASGRRLAAKPYYEAKPGWDALDHRLKTEPSGLLTQLLMPALMSCAEKAARAEAQHDILRLAVAACRFRAKHHRLPGGLAELAPDFTAAVPRDPFDGKPLRMHASAGKVVIYSIGPDMVDNGGAPFDRDKKTGDICFTLLDQPAAKPGR